MNDERHRRMEGPIRFLSALVVHGPQLTSDRRLGYEMQVDNLIITLLSFDPVEGPRIHAGTYGDTLGLIYRILRCFGENGLLSPTVDMLSALDPKVGKRMMGSLSRGWDIRDESNGRPAIHKCDFYGCDIFHDVNRNVHRLRPCECYPGCQCLAQS